MDQYILSLSYGKDSLACLGAIEKLGWPLDRIVHAEVWATDDIPADLPPMVEFKSKADEWIKEHFGIEVEHVFATKRERDEPTNPSSTNGILKESTSENFEDFRCSEDRGVTTGSRPQFSTASEKLTYEKIFYRERQLRRGGIRSTASRLSEVSGATDSSREMSSRDYRFCDKVESILHGRAQDGHSPKITGFQISVRRGNWCTALKTRVF